MPANSRPFSESLPSVDAQRVAGQLLQLLAAQRQGDAEITAHPSGSDGPVPLDLHPDVSDALMEVLRYMANGDAVTLVPINKLLTTQQAADILNVSRPHFIKLLERGDLPFVRVGRHRRVAASDVFAYKRKRSAGRSDALVELAKIDAKYL